MASLFAAVELAPRDPILGLNDQFNADPNPAKVNLGVGVYLDENGKLPLLQCVKAAEAQMNEAPKARNYLPIDGIAAYDSAVQDLVFGADHPIRKSGRIATVQALGGTGGLKLGADFLKRMKPGAEVLISDPSWENHRALFEGAGFPVSTYPYYDAKAQGIDLSGMLARLECRGARDHRRAARLLPQPDGLRHPGIGVAAGDRGGACPGAGRLPRHGLPGLRRRHRRGRCGGAAVPRSRHRLLRGDELLEELLAVRRAGRRAQHRLHVQGRSRPRAQPVEARHPHQLLESADPRCPGRHHGPDDAAPAGPMGAGTRRHARAHPADAGGPPGKARARPGCRGIWVSSPGSGACSAIRA